MTGEGEKYLVSQKVTVWTKTKYRSFKPMQEETMEIPTPFYKEIESCVMTPHAGMPRTNNDPESVGDS